MNLTTIAFDGEYLAADGRVTIGSTVLSEVCNKIYKLSGLYNGEQMLYAATAGDVDAAEDIIDYLRGDSPELKESKAQILLFTEGSIYSYWGRRFTKECDKYLAIGSGMEVALAAMKCGKNAKDAVKVASQMDIYTGGKIRCVRIRQPDTK